MYFVTVPGPEIETKDDIWTRQMFLFVGPDIEIKDDIWKYPHFQIHLNQDALIAFST